MHPSLDAFTRHTASLVVHQIFPERFAIGGRNSAQKLASPAHDLPQAQKRNWLQGTLLLLPYSHW